MPIRQLTHRVGDSPLAQFRTRHYASSLRGQCPPSVNPERRQLREGLSRTSYPERDFRIRLHDWIQHVRRGPAGSSRDRTDVVTVQKPGCLGKRCSSIPARTMVRGGLQQSGDTSRSLRKYVRIPFSRHHTFQSLILDSLTFSAGARSCIGWRFA